MLTLFSSNNVSTRGMARAIVLSGENNLPAMIQLQNFQNVLGLSALINRFEINESVLSQVTPMIGKATYAYIFNNAPADIVISGIGFHRGCQAGGGLAKLRRFYALHRATNRKDPIHVVILPNAVFRGILLGGSYHNEDPATQLVSFRYQIKAVGLDD